MAGNPNPVNNLPRGKAGPGRPKGSPNKITPSMKQIIQEVFEHLGGVEGFVAWVLKDPANERAFWTSIYPRLLSREKAISDVINTPLIVEFISKNE